MLVWILLLGAGTSSAQMYPVHHYTTQNGLLTNSLTDICQDSRGDLLIASAEGLSVFDGTSFMHYRTKDGLPSNSVTCVHEQPASREVWVGTNGGLALFRAPRFLPDLIDTAPRSAMIRS